MGVVARIGPPKSPDDGAEVLAATEVDVAPDVQTWGSEMTSFTLIILVLLINNYHYLCI